MFADIPEDDFYRYEDNLNPDAQQKARAQRLKQRLNELDEENHEGFYRPLRWGRNSGRPETGEWTDSDGTIWRWYDDGRIGYYRVGSVLDPTHTDTVREIVSSSLEDSGCIKCGASYGHKISCPKLNREAAAAEKNFDDFFLRSLRIQPF